MDTTRCVCCQNGGNKWSRGFHNFFDKAPAGGGCSSLRRAERWASKPLVVNPCLKPETRQTKTQQPNKLGKKKKQHENIREQWSFCATYICNTGVFWEPRSKTALQYSQNNWSRRKVGQIISPYKKKCKNCFRKLQYAGESLISSGLIPIWQQQQFAADEMWFWAEWYHSYIRRQWKLQDVKSAKTLIEKM